MYKLFTRAEGDAGGAGGAGGSAAAPGGEGTPATPGGSAPGGGGSPAATQPVVQSPTSTFQYASFVPEVDNFLGEIKDPEAPKEYSPAAFQEWQRQQAAVTRAREFKARLGEVFQAPVQVGEGVSLTFTSPEEARGFLRFLDEVRSGKRQLTPRDLMVLHRQEAVLKMASEYGARQHEKARGGGTVVQPGREQPKPGSEQPIVRPAAGATDDKTTGGRGKSIEAMLKERDPEYHKKFMDGTIRLTE